jgi:hypothetical protein
LAPVGVFDGEVVGKLTPDGLQAQLEKWSDNDVA